MSSDELKAQIASLDSQLKNPLPTPHIGCPVLWYPRGRVEEENAVAAIVTAVEGPGKVKLTVFKPNAMQEHKNGVHWAKHPAMEGKDFSQAKIHNGVWDYEKNSSPRKSHYDLHTQQLERKREAVLEAKRQQLEAEKSKANLAKSTTGAGEET